MIAVYGIRCVENDKYYVGSSTKVKARISTHKRSLRNGVHHSRKLQRAWDKYGEVEFFDSLGGQYIPVSIVIMPPIARRGQDA
jgi:hypothetical protein